MKYVLVFLAGMMFSGLILSIIIGCCYVAGKYDESTERDYQELQKKEASGEGNLCEVPTGESE